MKKKILFFASGCLLVLLAVFSGVAVTPHHSLTELKSSANSDGCQNAMFQTCYDSFQMITYHNMMPDGGFGG